MERRRELEFARLKAARDRYLDDARRIDLEIGRLAAAAIEEDQYATKSGIGRLLGISHTHVGNLIAAAEAAEAAQLTGAAEPSGVPILQSSHAAEYVVERGSKIVRSVSAFESSDALFQSGLDPRLFADSHDPSRVLVPSVLWQLDSGEWIGVDEASVGYGGTGCDYTKSALTAAGVDEDSAKEIVSWRFCDAVDIADPSSWSTQTRWPVHARGVPSIIGDRIVVDFGEGLDRIRDYGSWSNPFQPEVDESGFYPSVTPLSNFEAWIDFLDGAELPSWAQGTCVARVFFSREEAESQGFIRHANDYGTSRGQSSCPTVVVEQGEVQLWGHFYPSPDKTQMFPRELYDTLSIAGVYPHSLAERDERNARPWSRFLRTLFGPGQSLPASIDISHSGSDHLVYTPAAAAVMQPVSA